MVVYLQTSLAQQLQRVGKGRAGRCSRAWTCPARLAELRAVREPLYREIADITLSTDNRRVARVAEMVLEELGLAATAAEPFRARARSILRRLC